MNSNSRVIKVTLVDIDGCLNRPKGSDKDLFQLSRVKAFCRIAGDRNDLPALCIATGRNTSYVEATLQDLGIQDRGTLPHIIENGAALLYSSSKGERIVPHPKTGAFLQLKPKLEQAFLDIQAAIACAPDLEKRFMMTFYPLNGTTIKALYKVVCEKLEKYADVVDVTFSSSAVDVVPKGITKAEGVLFFCQETGIDAQNILAIGDSGNDAEMLSLAQFAACPSNATEEVRFIVSAHGENGYLAKGATTAGVAETLEYFFDVELPDTRFIPLGLILTIRNKRDMMCCSLPERNVHFDAASRQLRVKIPQDPQVAITREQIKALSDPSYGNGYRWAAGGIAPLLVTNQGTYLVAFYRDKGAMSYPDTLTIPTGMSANEQEFLDPYQTMLREGFEEVLISVSGQRLVGPRSRGISNVINSDALMQHSLKLSKFFWPNCSSIEWQQADVMTTPHDFRVHVDWDDKKRSFSSLVTIHQATNGIDLVKIVRWVVPYNIKDILIADGEEKPDGSMLNRTVYLIPIASVKSWVKEKQPLFAEHQFTNGRNFGPISLQGIEALPFMVDAMQAIADL